MQLKSHAGFDSLPSRLKGNQMKLEQIRPCFTYMTLEEQESFFCQYYERRNQDLKESIIAISSKKAAKLPGRTKDKKVSVTPEQLALLKKMGFI